MQYILSLCTYPLDNNFYSWLQINNYYAKIIYEQKPQMFTFVKWQMIVFIKIGLS